MRISSSHRSPRRRASALACALLAGCGPAAEAGSAGTVVLRPEARYEFYDVEGVTARELAASIRRAAPPSQRGAIGYTTWNVTWQAEWDGNPCRVRRADVRATIVVSMPRWNAPPNAPRRLVEEWNRFLVALSVHEAGHVAHGVQAEREVRRTLMAVSAPNCLMMASRTRQAAQWVVDEYRERNRDYDERTRRGFTQGAVWPPGAPADTSAVPADDGAPAQPWR
jgi:predicted secreted Zn-dependent protease